MAWSEYEIGSRLEMNEHGDRIKVFTRSGSSSTTITLGERAYSAVWDGKFVKVTLKNETRLYSDTSNYKKV